ncbi:hypothetical protein PMAYCL1PPCAC_04258, partial [Pristionchus mayeri]
MSLDVGQTQLREISIQHDGQAPKQKSSLSMFKDSMHPNEDLVHFMPCNTTYEGHDDDFSESGKILKKIYGDKKDNKVTLVTRTMNEQQVKDAFNIDSDDVHIIDERVDEADIADRVSDF